ncbi:hypothetical protein H8K90_12485 [Winogradskyella echinorum]|uniref:Uncharacterized protein n=1 Tax=Winogradskyella echinorum TaxID=538189 RepID=A0ABR6Y4P1_9FLAO|nr:hypothetical protein [Winogradskyella echinorum]MBC3847205.1 hypothetical protein [Winogradskyella echinorum]MBC5751553.1 hypothetical protein [Winogradskyella echinorum]
MAEYKMEDINIGDGVYFKLDFQTNYDLYWTVKSKFDSTLEIEVNEMGANDKIFLNIKDVYAIEKRT